MESHDYQLRIGDKRLVLNPQSDKPGAPSFLVMGKVTDSDPSGQRVAPEQIDDALVRRKRAYLAPEPRDGQVTAFTTYVVIRLDLLCNLGCSYCFQGSFADGSRGQGMGQAQGTIPDKVWKKLIDHAFYCAHARNYPDVTVKITGGEPLVYPEMVKAVVEYAREQEKAMGKKCITILETGAFVQDAKLVEWLGEHLDWIKVSHDGPNHDQYRKTRGGKGTSQVVLDNLRAWAHMRSDRHPGGKCGVYVNSVVNTADIDTMLETFRFLHGQLPGADILLSPLQARNYPHSRYIAGLKQLVDELTDDEWNAFVHRFRSKPTTRLIPCGTSGEVVEVTAARGERGEQEYILNTCPDATYSMQIRQSRTVAVWDEEREDFRFDTDAIAHISGLSPFHKDHPCIKLRCPLVTLCGGGCVNGYKHAQGYEDPVPQPLADGLCDDLRAFKVAMLKREEALLNKDS